MSQKTRRSLICIYFISFLDLFAVSLMIPLFAPHLKSIGASHLIIGLSSSLYAGAQLVSGPLVGSWSDHNGRLQVLSFSLAACSVCYLLLGQITSLPIILILRILLGCMKHTQSLCKALVADLVPMKKQTEAFGIMAAASGVGFVVGPAVGGHLAEINHSFFYISVIIAISFWLNIALAYFAFDKSQMKNDGKHSLKSESFDLVKVFKHLTNVNWKASKSILCLKLVFVYTIALRYNNYSLSLREEFNLSPKAVGYIISFQAFIGSLFGLFSGQIQNLYRQHYSPKMATLKQITHNFFLLEIALLGMGCANNLPMLIMSLIPFGLSQSLLRNLLTKLLVENAAPQERGSLLGTAHSLSALARLCAPLIAGVSTDISSLAIPCLTQIGAAIGIIMSVHLYSQS